MTDFKDMNPIDRRKFLGGLLAIGASAGVLGKLGLEDVEWTSAGPGELDLEVMFRQMYSDGETPKVIWATDECMNDLVRLV